MGWIICRASVSVVGLSASAGHSSGVAPCPGVEGDSLQKEAGAGPVIFKQRHTSASWRETRLWPAGPARTVQAGPTGPFCHSTRARPSDSFPHQPVQNLQVFGARGQASETWRCQLSPRRRRPDAPTGPAAKSPARAAHPAPPAVTGPQSLSGLGPPAPGSLDVEKGMPSKTRAPRAPLRGRGRRPGAGTGASAAGLGLITNPSRVRARQGPGWSEGRRGPRGKGHGW